MNGRGSYQVARVGRVFLLDARPRRSTRRRKKVLYPESGKLPPRGFNEAQGDSEPSKVEKGSLSFHSPLSPSLHLLPCPTSPPSLL